MDSYDKTTFYINHYQEIYDYIKVKVKTPEQAVEATQETFAELFEKIDVQKDFGELLNIAKNIADHKCKERSWAREKKWLEKLAIGAFVVLLVMLVYWDASPKKEMKEKLESWGDWDYKSEEEFASHAIFMISGCTSTADFMDGGDANSPYWYAGIGDISLIKDGAMNWVEPDEKFYVAFIQVHNEEDVGQIISLIKQRVIPGNWYGDDSANKWHGVSIEEFEFYVNRDCILITYVDSELVENGQRPSVKKMRANFDALVELLHER